MPSAAPVTVFTRRVVTARLARLLDVAIDVFVGVVAAAGFFLAITGVTASWSAVVCFPLAAVALAAAVRGLRAVFSGVEEVDGVLEHAGTVTVSGPRADYRMVQFVVDGRTYEVPARGAPGASALQPRRRVHLRVLADGEVLRVAVEPGSPPRPSLAPSAVSPAPLTEAEVRLAVSWAARGLVAAVGLFAGLIVVVKVAADASTGLALLAMVVLLGAMLRIFDAWGRLVWARQLAPGSAVVVVEGRPTRRLGIVPELRIGGRRVEVAAPGSQPSLERAVRGRAAVCPPSLGTGGVGLVVVSWEDSVG